MRKQDGVASHGHARPMSSFSTIARKSLAQTKDFLFLTLISSTVYLVVSLYFHRIDKPILMDVDEQDYYNLAGAILHHQYIFDLRRPPVHVLLISIFRFVTGDNFIKTRALAAVFFGLSGPLMYVLA